MADRAATAHRRPWLPARFFVFLLIVIGIGLILRIEPRSPDEPRGGGPIQEGDPAVTAPLLEFLNEDREEASASGESGEIGGVIDENFQRGIALGLYSQEVDYDYEFLIREIAEHGAGWISFFYTMYQENGRSTSIDPLTRIIDQERMLRQAADQAHRLGMKVLSFPVVLLSDPADDEWRGNIKPDDMDRWFEDYGDHIVRLARVAEKSGIEAVAVGSEFSSLEREGDRWRALIAEVREVYSGQVIYSANWDHYESVPFWRDVDAIGLSGYYELTRSKTPALEELVEEWETVRDRVLEWHREEGFTQPIVFTEIGYANQDGTNIHPWDYTREAPPDPEEQALCYEAFIRAWHGQPGFAGAFFYNWFGYDTLDDTGYSPRGKPAAQLIRAWYEFLSPEEN